MQTNDHEQMNRIAKAVRDIDLSLAPSEVKKRNGFPIPQYLVTGKRILIYQDEIETVRIFVPKTANRRSKPTSGTILQIGDGYGSMDLDWLNWTCPFNVGDSVAFSKWEDRAMKIDVLPGWWTPEEEEVFSTHPRPDNRVEFLLVDSDEIWGKIL